MVPVTTHRKHVLFGLSGQPFPCHRVVTSCHVPAQTWINRLVPRKNGHSAITAAPCLSPLMVDFPFSNQPNSALVSFQWQFSVTTLGSRRWSTCMSCNGQPSSVSNLRKSRRPAETGGGHLEAGHPVGSQKLGEAPRGDVELCSRYHLCGAVTGSPLALKLLSEKNPPESINHSITVVSMIGF